MPDDDGGQTMSPEALTDANNHTVALVNSMVTKQAAADNDMAQLELTMEQLPSQVTAEVLDLFEEQNNHLTSKLTEQNNILSAKLDSLERLVGRSSPTPPTTPAAIRQAMTPANRHQSLNNYGLDWLSSSQVKPYLPGELLFDSAFKQAVAELENGTSQTGTGSGHLNRKRSHYRSTPAPAQYESMEMEAPPTCKASGQLQSSQPIKAPGSAERVRLLPSGRYCLDQKYPTCGEKHTGSNQQQSHTAA